VICERADIGTGTRFLYVKDKREQLSLIFQPLAKEAFARLDRKIDKSESLIDGLIRVFAELFHLYGQDTAMSRLFIQDLLFRDNDSTGLKLLHDELRERVTKLVSAAQRRKELRSDISAEQLGISFLAHYVLWLQMWLGSGGVSRSSATRGLRLALQLQIEGAGKERTDQ
jgi:AcrR family transcriptional regulator